MTQSKVRCSAEIIVRFITVIYLFIVFLLFFITSVLNAINSITFDPTVFRRKYSA